MPARRISASWILPVTGEPIRDGAVLIDSTGLIVAIGPDHEVPRTPDIKSDHHPGCIVTPGLVNTHTHLELTGLGPVIAEADFPSWIRMLRARKATRSQAEFERAAETGLRQCWAAGVTTVADTGDTGAAARALAELASAEQNFAIGDYSAALNFAERARRGLPRNTPSYQRASDIVNFAGNEVRDRMEARGRRS